MSKKAWLEIIASHQRNPRPRSLVLDRQAKLTNGFLLAITGLALLRLSTQNLTDSLTRGHLTNLVSRNVLNFSGFTECLERVC